MNSLETRQLTDRDDSKRVDYSFSFAELEMTVTILPAGASVAVECVVKAHFFFCPIHGPKIDCKLTLTSKRRMQQKIYLMHLMAH